jgi:Uncharacterized protein conserved in bacteria (DUF2314)
MKSRATTPLLLTLVFTVAIAAQQPVDKDKGVYLAPNAPESQPKHAHDEEELRKMEEAIKPAIEQARKTYPEAKARFLAGLPPQHTFFVTTRLVDQNGAFEQVFVAVKEIRDGTIQGLIWSDISLVPGYKHGDSYSFPETELLDWTITRPDGTEEGNFVGKFLDTYQPG